MVQYGQNAGPRHLRVFGHVRNLKNTNISKSDQTEKDHRLLGIFGIVWNLFLAIAPAPVIEACNKAMDEVGIPRMESVYDEQSKSMRHIKKKHSEFSTEVGYTLEMKSEAITFNTAVRAPCEGYVLQDYAAYVQQSILSFTFCLLNHMCNYRPVHTDRSWTGFSFSLSTTYSTVKASIPQNGTGGGNYIDVDMKVVVMMDTDTALVKFDISCHLLALTFFGIS